MHLWKLPELIMNVRIKCTGKGPYRMLTAIQQLIQQHHHTAALDKASSQSPMAG